MKRILLILFLAVTAGKITYSQVGISPDSSTPDPSAGLDVKFTNKGFLPPRMTRAEMNAIVNPANGLVVYCSDCGADSAGGLAMVTAGAWFLLSATCLNPVPPMAATHTASTNWIRWTWHPVPNATGYRWNSWDDYSMGGNVGTDTAYTQYGLVPGTTYTSYVWTQSPCGISASAALTKVTVTPPVCGPPMTVNHVAGTVAPVTKTTTYAMVSNVPGLPEKCWITSNLGSTHQAAYVGDDTEASAGWYWQFNRKQGYMHDGYGLTPNTAWIHPISENSEWVAANDPCTLELGVPWRMPTYTEWVGVSVAGNWTNWTGPFNSPLKVHAAGGLWHETGGLLNRGTHTIQWTSTQWDPDQGYHMYYHQFWAHFVPNPKSYGFPIRCLK